MNGELSWDEGGSPLHAGQPSRCRRRIPLSNTILLPPASRVLFSIPRYGKEVFRMQKKQFWPVEALTVTAMLIACQVVLGNLLQVPLLGKQYNFGFVPIAMAGALLGPVPAMLVGGLGDLIGAHLFPAGAYFPGFTLTNVLVGLVCGLFLHGRKPSLWRCGAAVIIALAGVTLPLNSYWLHLLAYVPGRGYWGWLVIRAPNYLVEVPVNMVLCYALLHALRRVKLPASMQLRR
jgi:ECF transporter S component (folate family)